MSQRCQHDDYPTPPYCVEQILNELYLPCPEPGYWLEPCAGNGSLIQTVFEHYEHKGLEMSWTAVEIQERYEECMISLGRQHPGRVSYLMEDFLFPATLSNLQPISNSLWMFDVAITNPPFSLAELFVRECRKLAKHVVMLLRLNFLGSVGRWEWLRSDTPDVYVLPNRPCFKLNDDGKPGTDRTEYAWFHWPEERGRTSGKMVVLPAVDARVVKAYNESLCVK